MRTAKKAFVLLILIAGTSAYAQEMVVREDFIGITKKVIDALDEVEAVCDDPQLGKKEVDKALIKLRKAREEYKRYEVNTHQIEAEQKEIMKAIAKAERSFTIFSLSLGPCYAAPTEDEITQAKWYAEIVRGLFLRYAEKK